MVDINGKTSNTLFEVFETWESYLKAEKINIPKLLRKGKTNRIRQSSIQKT